MNKLKSRINSSFAFLLAVVMILSTFTVQIAAFDVDYTRPASELPSLELGGQPTATEGATFNNTGEGEDWISLTEARSFEAKIPVTMTAEQAKAAISSEKFKWTLSRTEPYLSTDLYPNYKKGDDLTAWKDSKNESSLFTDINTTVVQEEGTVFLKLEFSSIPFYADGSVPHGSATYTMDYIGWYSLAAMNDVNVLGSAAAKVVPYDDFHTMGEVYDEIDALDAYKTGYYTERLSMGLSQVGYDMPYLIVAKDKKAVDNWLELCERAETEPAKVLEEMEKGELKDYKVPVIYSNIHSNEASATDSILKFAWMLLKNKSINYDVLTGFTEEGKAQLEKEMGPAGTQGSVATPDLVKDSATYLGYLKAGNKESGRVDLEKYYDIDTQKVNVSDLLDDVFFILVPEENVEGRIYMSRVSSGGLDLNRDNSFQTQKETQNMQKLIGTYNPVSFTELHGRVKAYQVEPCDPPHEPNFEYDLLAENLMPGGEAFGIAAVANNDGYNSYVTPQRDYLEYTGKTLEDGSYETYWADPWDDMSTSYTPQFAMLHGTVAYTVEVPAYNDAVTQSLAYGQLGQSVYVADNKEGYLKAQLKIYERGLTNFNSNAFELVGQWFCDQYDVEGAEAALFRPEYDGPDENGNFYPEAYIIPLDASNQSNLQAAFDMMKWLSRNDVKIVLAQKAFTYKGVNYPAGTMIVTMYQAKRSVANGALYDGTLIEDWTVLYSEGITTFNETRGFDMATVTEPNAYETMKTAFGTMMDYEDCLAYLEKVTSSFSGPTGNQVIISNDSEDSTAAVNALLKAGKTVGMITSGEDMGDFICSYTDWETIKDDFILTGIGIDKDYPAARIITKSPTIYINGVPGDSTAGYINYSRITNSNYNYDRQAMDLTNFKTTTNVSEADVIIGANVLSGDALTAVQKGVPFVGYGSNGAGAKTLDSLFSGIARSAVSRSMDALAYVTYPTKNLINASYVKDKDDVMYGYGAGYFAAVPEGSQVLVRTDENRKPTEGFLRSSDPDNLNAFLGGSIQAFSYQGNDKGGNTINVALFANSLTHKVHQRDEYAFISNFAFSNVLGRNYSVVNFKDVSGWAKDYINYLGTRGIITGKGNGTFNPDGNITRAEFVKILANLAGADLSNFTKSTFSDVKTTDWYFTAVQWANEKGIVLGSNGKFNPNANINRQDLAVILSRYADKAAQYKLPETNAAVTFADSGKIAGYASEAVKAVQMAGIISGYPDGSFGPSNSATRAEASKMVAVFMQGMIE